MSDKPSNERQYYDALKLISTAYMSLAQLRKAAKNRSGLSYEETLEMSYENVIEKAKSAIKGKKPPKISGEP